MHSENAVMSDRHYNIGRRAIRIADSIVDYAMLAFFLILFCAGIYVVWDSRQIYREADAKQYEIYNPIEGQEVSFTELQGKNPDVFGWLTIYGTNINYPLVQGEDNEEYLDKDAFGKSSTAGSLFLDYRNAKDLSDSSSIVYGHHMDKNAMFGELDQFTKKKFFDGHQYGVVYNGQRTYGVDIFAFIEADAYNTVLYTPQRDDAGREALLDEIESNALHMREADVADGEKILLLSTCTSDITNGRYILAGKLTEEFHKDPFKEKTGNQKEIGEGLGISRIWFRAGLVVLFAVLIGVYAFLSRRRRKRRDE